MNTEYVWWFLALLLAGGAMVAFLAVGRVPEVEDEPLPDEEPAVADRPAGAPPGEQEASGAGPQSVPVRTTVPGPDPAASTSDTP